MAQLTGDQIAAICVNVDFLSRIKATLIIKSQYWKSVATPNRSDVNQQMQKRKRLAALISSTPWVDSNRQQVGQYWLGLYQTSTPILDGNGIPTYNEIFNNFDPTYDFFAGYNQGDENETEIVW